MKVFDHVNTEKHLRDVALAWFAGYTPAIGRGRTGIQTSHAHYSACDLSNPERNTSGHIDEHHLFNVGSI